MGQRLRRIAVRVLIPLSWSLSRRRIAISLDRFSEVEADSAWQMLQALEGVNDPRFRAELFNNALEEVHHSDLFAGLARRYDHSLRSLAPSARKQLFDPAKGLSWFEAVHYVGEVDVFEHFLSYAAAARHPEIRAMFLRIRGDEAEHQRLAYEELVASAGSEAEVRKMIRSVRRRRAWEQGERLGRAVGDLMCSAVLSALYYLFGPFVFLGCRRRLSDSGREVAVGSSAEASPVTVPPRRSEPTRAEATL